MTPITLRETDLRDPTWIAYTANTRQLWRTVATPDGVDSRPIEDDVDDKLARRVLDWTAENADRGITSADVAEHARFLKAYARSGT